MKPIRIQRKRIKGWRMPENTVNVTRPGRFGNPFYVIKEEGYFVVTTNLWVLIPKLTERKHQLEIDAINECIELFKSILGEESISVIKKDLAKKNLACFCPLDKPCHADVLLKIANE